jgi:CheY-like chemotaxis protein
MFYSSLQTSPNAVFLVNCSSEEKQFLVSLAKLLKGEIVYYDKAFSMESLKRNQILFIDSYENSLLIELLTWSIQVQVVGRMQPSEKIKADNAGLVSYWDLEKDSIQTLGRGIFQNIQSPFPIDSLVWTDHKKFNHRMKSLLDRFSIDEVVTNHPDAALIALKEQKFDLLILDWDTCGLEPIKILKEFRQIKSQRHYFPKVIGIKDFTKMNLFKDLSLGIKDFCPVLFNYTEVIELLSDSLPVGREEVIGLTYIQDKPYLKLNRGKDFFNLQFIYPEDKEFKKEKYILSDAELGFHIFKKQFLWLKEREQNV